VPDENAFPLAVVCSVSSENTNLVVARTTGADISLEAVKLATAAVVVTAN